MSDHILLSRAGGVLEARFNRPEKKNAITSAMYGALADALDASNGDADVRVVLFTAAGDMFTAGNDIMDFAAVAAGAPREANREVARFLDRLINAEKPLVAAVQGNAVGVGVTMLLHCDLVYVAEDAKLLTPFVDLGLVPENASSLTLPARLGHARAFAMLGLCEPVTGPDAAAFGIANAALPAYEVESHAREAAQKLAKKPPEALRLTKRLMRDRETLTARMREESELFGERLRSPEAAAAFAGFLSKRA